MKIESRELNTTKLITKLCERLITNQSLNFNDFIITLNNNNNMSVN